MRLPWRKRERITANTQEAYPPEWLHATIHLNPRTGELHSDGDHSVRQWLIERLPSGGDTRAEGT